MKDQEIKEKVNTVLKMMEQQFHKVEPSLMNAVSRQEYFEKHPELTQEQKLNFPFSLSAQDIIDKKIPWLVSGCTGCSRLFSKYARDIGLNDFKVVLTVKTDQIGKQEGQIHGHQVIAVNMSDGLHIIDVQHGLGKTFEEIEVKSECKVDEEVNFQQHNDYTIAAILTPQEYDTIDSYEKIKKIYLGCNTAKKILLNDATKKLQIINDNKKLTLDNYSQSSTEKLGKKIWSILSPYITKNTYLYQNLTKQDYNTKQKCVIDVFNLLLSEFPSKDKPKIYFKEDIDKIINNCTDENLKNKIKQYTNVSAMFYSPLLNYYAKDMIKSVIGTEEPFFMFYNGLSVEPDILGLIVHEFIHYLQSIGQSSIPQQTIQKACEYYKYIYADATLSKQLHDDSIHEVEARDIAKYINEQIKLMQKTIISSKDYTK